MTTASRMWWGRKNECKTRLSLQYEAGEGRRVIPLILPANEEDVCEFSNV